MTTRAEVEAECERLGLDLDDVREYLRESESAGGDSRHHVYEGHPNYWPSMLEAIGSLEEQRQANVNKPGAQSDYYDRTRKDSLT